ncbi:hypothetical protein M422DRAFT_33977 [Sphaerobolus stellatus SS14]|uniref:F-box domain-containing protein n=1 Tax=Sphaerobolus stellatus (strain SS14) TaxID=990650 RepID=A0A0C9VI52_SPHS4|nr:hypothetical protein M422DRAFT_33977 [Sphaerobolus stellatus SS14]
MAISRTSFMKLPEELVATVIMELPMLDILHCRLVCKRLNNLVQSSSNIKYKIELSAHGLVSCPASKISAASALKMLRDQQARWRRCEWGNQTEIILGGGCRTYDLRHGIWAYGQSDEQLTDDMLLDYTKKITCYKLGGVDRGIKCKEWESWSSWSLDDLKLDIRDFTIDPVIDMLAMVVQLSDESKSPFQVLLRKLSDGEPHPLGGKTVLDLEMPCTIPANCTFTMQLQGYSLGVLVRQDASETDWDYFFVWDWRTGKLNMSQHAENSSFDDFAFVDSTTIMLTVLANPVTLQIWRFDEPTDEPKLSPVGIFAMPKPALNHAYLEMHFDGGPSASPGGPRTLDGTPYALAPVPKILSISFTVLETDAELQESEAENFTMVMQPSLMLKVLAKKQNPLQRHADHILEWGQWGPQCTRWIPQTISSLNWEPCSVGGRFVLVAPAWRDEPDDEEGLHFIDLPQVIRLYDFRPEIVRRYKGQELGKNETLVMEQTVISKDNTFEEDVYSSLPYHLATSRELPYQVSGVMIDEGHLVCTKGVSEDDDDWQKLLVLSF